MSERVESAGTWVQRLCVLSLSLGAGCATETAEPPYSSPTNTGGNEGGSSGGPVGTTGTAGTSSSTTGTNTSTTGAQTTSSTGTTGSASSTGGAQGSTGTSSTGAGGSGNTGAGGTSGAGGSTTTGGTATGSGTTGAEPVTKFVGNITTGRNASADTNDRTFSTYWDQITPENAGKWGSVQSSASSGFNWATLDAVYDYAQRTGIIFKQHTFVWGTQQPSGNISETHVRTWMSEFCARYPETRLIDVVNEPPPHTTPAYADAIGGGTNGNWQWIVNAFNWARESCPNAILILNDYNNIEWADQNQHFIDIATTVQAAGAPIDAVGAQAHGLTQGVSAETMRQLATKLHDDTGLPVYITEYDIDIADDGAQLERYQQHMPFFLETEWIHGITLWGWIHGSTWVPNSGLIRNGTPRPAMTWLMEQLGRPAP